MHWSELLFWISIVAALVVGVSAIVRWKWYGLVPATILGYACIAAGVFGHFYLHGRIERVLQKFDLLISLPPAQWAMVWLLACAATLVSSTSIWAGYSRGHWFWRLSALAGIPAILAWIDAQEPILFCLATMPVIAGGAWLLRRRQDSFRKPDSACGGEHAGVQSHFRLSLREALLAFIDVGLVAMAMRPLASDSRYLVAGHFASATLAFVVVSLLSSGVALTRTTRRRWQCSLLALIVTGGSLLVHRWWNVDALGLSYYLHDASGISRRTVFIFDRLGIGAAATLAALILLGNLYAAATRSRSLAWRRIGACLLAGTVAAVVAPLVFVYPRMAPHRGQVTPLPPSVTYDKIQATGRGATVQTATAALAQPGNVWYDVREFQENELSLKYHMSLDCEQSLSIVLREETAMAEQTGRFSKCLDLAILQWRLGRVLRRGGIYMDWAVGFQAESYGCGAVSQAVENLSEADCRRALDELRRSLADRPSVETVLAYDAYWHQACFGWREKLYHGACWLAREIEPSVDKERLRDADKRGLLRLRLLEVRLALELYRRQHGDWPSRLQQLVPEHLSAVPVDPYSNGSLAYRRDGADFLLYSVGPDGRDDGCRKSNDPREVNFAGRDIDWAFDRRIQAADY